MQDVILGIPFINLLEPYTTLRKDISANILGTTVSFKFAEKSKKRNINLLKDLSIQNQQINLLIKYKENQINYFKKYIFF